MANGDQIKQEVLAELAWDPRLTPSSIVVSVEDGVVTLSGWVDSLLKRWAADRAAFRIRDVRGIANKIEVRLPPPAKRTDVEIADTPALALASNAGIATEPIDVSVQDGVRSWGERANAERVARSAPGVTGVDNQLVVTSHEEDDANG